MTNKKINLLFITKSEKIKITRERNLSLLKDYQEAIKNRKGSEFLREKAKELEMQEGSLRNMIILFRNKLAKETKNN